MKTTEQLKQQIERLADFNVELRQRAERAEAALAERDAPCYWVPPDGNYAATHCETTCGFYPDLDLESTRYVFCPYCGHPLHLVPSDNDLLSGDAS